MGKINFAFFKWHTAILHDGHGHMPKKPLFSCQFLSKPISFITLP